jgi:hypothetical protein
MPPRKEGKNVTRELAGEKTEGEETEQVTGARETGDDLLH